MIYMAGDWSISSSTGASVTVGTPTLKVQVGGGHIGLPLYNKTSGKNAKLIGYGIGAAGGVALETPITDWISGSLSTSEMPSTGIGPNYRKNIGSNKAYSSSDFEGFMTVITGSAGVAATNGTVSAALWHRNSVTRCVTEGLRKCNFIAAISETSLALNPAGAAHAIITSTHAIGFFVGIEAVTDLAGASASVFTYRVKLA